MIVRVVPCLTLALALMLASAPVHAQTAEPKPDSQATDKDVRKADEFAEAARQIEGEAGKAECVWLGRRIVNLLWRDDLDTAFRHFDLYDRFGCPSAHVQTTFRCVVRQGAIDPKAPESLATRVHQCWINPGAAPVAAAAPAKSPGAEGTRPQ